MATMTLTGEIGELDGTASADIQLTIRSNTVVVDAGGNVVFDDAVTVTAVAGVFTVDLPAPGPGMTPDAWGYIVTRLVGYPRRWQVPAAAGTFDLSQFTDTTAIPVTDTAATQAQLVAETAARVAGDAALQAAIDAVEAGDVDSVAGLTGVVTDAALKTALNLPADTAADLAAETAARVAADADLQAQVDAVESAERAVSTDGSFGLPAPTGVGLEFVIAANVLEDIRMNGSSL